MSNTEITRLAEENARLLARLRRLADEKSNLQLVVSLIEQLNPLPGIQDMVTAMLYSIVETIGGTNIKLYYFVEGELHYSDFAGKNCILSDYDDPMVAQVAAQKSFIEKRGEVGDALLIGKVAPGSWTWGFPLLVGDELIGIIKLENLHLNSASLCSHLPTFFSHAALILNNEIRNELRKRAALALHASEEAFRGTFNQAAVGIAHVGMDGSWLKVNQKLCDIVGYTEEELVQLTFQEITHPDDLNADLNHVSEVLAGTINNFSMEKRYLRKTGDYIWVNLTVSLIRKQDGSPNYFISVVEDISDRKRAAAELLRYKDHLEEEVEQRTTELVLARDSAEAANKAKSTFLASISHELRTPLNAILGFSSLMRKDASLNENQQQNLDIINRSGTHLLTLINDVLEMAKIEAGRVQLDNVPFDLGRMVRDVVDMMQNRATEKGLQLILDQSSDFPRFINGDEARLRQILINLTGNAVKFTRQGGVTIRLGTKENSISHLLMEVEDSGHGISEDEQQRLFQPFVQLGKQAGDNKGTGLGLAITRQFVQLMGGTINCVSTLGKGSLFRVELPLSEAKESEVIKPTQPKRGDIIGVVADQSSYRILIVEDQKENQLLPNVSGFILPIKTHLSN